MPCPFLARPILDVPMFPTSQRRFVKKLVASCLFCLGTLILAGPAQAQVIWGGEAERGFRPGTSIPYDGESFPHRYNYSTGAFFYPWSTMDGRRLSYLDYADRLERAYKFGYQVPRDPFQTPPAPPSAGRVRVGVGLGLFRWR
jgi:hypothetical protein